MKKKTILTISAAILALNSQVTTSHQNPADSSVKPNIIQQLKNNLNIILKNPERSTTPITVGHSSHASHGSHGSHSSHSSGY